MPVTKITNNSLDAGAALSNLNAGANITFTKQVIVPSFGASAAFGVGVITALAITTNSGGGFVTADGTATLTNKTLTTPTINTIGQTIGNPLQVNANYATSINGSFQVRNSATNGLSATSFLTPGYTQRGFIGYGNTSATNYPDEVFFCSVDRLLSISTVFGSRHLVISTTGNVGIGTTTPSERLTVSGNISASGTVIASNYNPASNVAAFLATPTSANLAAAVTDETGTGALVFANTPTLITPNIGVATGTSLSLSGNLSIPNQSTNNLTGALNQKTLLQSGNKYRIMTRVGAQNNGTGSSSDAYLTLGMGCQISNTNGSTASSYTYDSIASHAGYSGATMKNNIDLEAYFHGVMFRVEANENWVLRINFGVGAATRVPPLAGVVAATARQWGVEIYYDTPNNDYKLRMYWYDTSINYGTPVTIPTLTAANWVGMIYSIRMRQTSTGLLEFYISTPNGLSEGAGDIPSTPLTSMQATWTNTSYAGRHINFEVAAATAAAPTTQIRIHAATMHCAYK